MELGNTNTLDSQFKEVELNINEREQAISRIIEQHDIPIEWFDRDFNAETHNFNTDAIKEAYHKVVHFQNEIHQYINTFCISRDKLQDIPEKIDISVVNAHTAKMAIVNSSLRLVVNIAKKYTNRNSNLELLDLIHVGNIGLMKAIDNFHYERGYKFNTYATWWIRQDISRAVSSAEGNQDLDT